MLVFASPIATTGTLLDTILALLASACSISASGNAACSTWTTF
ncbi:hypothetical protein [Nocardia aurantia]|uniref:Uncharacterized protein n=1 Tax=Nocardia aurantia TaxID=2585199 RepID=A0A7K0DRY1_9NOCA|nr:hypothetical protein [Nocardia aurantia]MQY28509.1 hypothetical protein [Nocardia aurantia]